MAFYIENNRKGLVFRCEWAKSTSQIVLASGPILDKQPPIKFSLKQARKVLRDVKRTGYGIETGFKYRIIYRND